MWAELKWLEERKFKIKGREHIEKDLAGHNYFCSAYEDWKLLLEPENMSLYKISFIFLFALRVRMHK